VTRDKEGQGGLAATPETAKPPVAEAIEVSRRFGPTLALAKMSLSIAVGESRALLGRNGAGKSTLVGIITGLLRPDSGSVLFNGQPAPSRAQRDRWRAHVACVYQKSMVIPSLTVAENLVLNRYPETRFGRIDWAAVRRETRAFLDEWDIPVDANTPARELTGDQRQALEIAAALSVGARFIVLDEPTAELEAREIGRLFERIQVLRAAGVSFLYISHRIGEIFEICQSVTVLRDGRLVESGPLDGRSQRSLVEAMVGDAGMSFTRARVRSAEAGSTEATPTTDNGAAPVLEVRNVTVPMRATEITFSLGPGRLVGLAGLGSSGKEEIANVVAGLVRPSRGEVRVHGKPVEPGRVDVAVEMGIGYVPGDRHERGLVPAMAVEENITLTIMRHLGPAGFVKRAFRNERASRLMKELEVVAASGKQPVSELSGGNQQKVVFGRCFASNPRVLVLVNPTSGVDVASKGSLFGAIQRSCAAGAAVLIVSDDLDELRDCLEVLVMFRGRITARFGEARRDQDLIAAIEGGGVDGLA